LIARDARNSAAAQSVTELWKRISCKYTDGIVEARSAAEEDFGEERLKEAIANLYGGSVGRVTQGIRDRLQRFTNRPDVHDDATLMVFRRAESQER